MQDISIFPAREEVGSEASLQTQAPPFPRPITANVLKILTAPTANPARATWGCSQTPSFVPDVVLRQRAGVSRCRLVGVQRKFVGCGQDCDTCGLDRGLWLGKVDCVGRSATACQRATPSGPWRPCPSRVNEKEEKTQTDLLILFVQHEKQKKKHTERRRRGGGGNENKKNHAEERPAYQIFI